MNKKMIVNMLALIFLTFFAIPVTAGIFICHNANGSITNRASSGGAVYSNNPDCFRITIEQYNTVTNSTHKVAGGALVNLTQQEIDDRNAAKVQAVANAETARIKAFDDSFTAAQISDATLANIDKEIDKITDSATRAFLKKWVRDKLND